MCSPVLLRCASTPTQVINELKETNQAGRACMCAPAPLPCTGSARVMLGCMLTASFPMPSDEGRACHVLPCLGLTVSSPCMEDAMHAHRPFQPVRGVAWCRSWRPRCASWSSWCGSRTQRSRRSWPNSPAQASHSVGGRAPRQHQHQHHHARARQGRAGAVGRCLPAWRVGRAACIARACRRAGSHGGRAQ